MLVERMVAPEDRARVPTPDDARLDGMVRGIEFVRERSAPNRYIATLNVVFSARAGEGLAGRGAASRSPRRCARPALVIPLWKGKAGVEPLDDRNAWREAWQALDTAGSAVPVTVIRGDQLDQNAVSAEEAYVGDVSALSRLERALSRADDHRGDRRGRQGSPDRSRSAACATTRRPARAARLPKATVQDAGQLADAAKQMHAKLDEQWRGVAVVRRDAQDTLDVFVPIRALGDWVQVRQRLGGVPAIKSVVGAHPGGRSRRAAPGVFRHPRGAAAHAGAGRPDARQGSRQVAIAGAVIARGG